MVSDFIRRFVFYEEPSLKRAYRRLNLKQPGLTPGSVLFEISLKHDGLFHDAIWLSRAAKVIK